MSSVAGQELSISGTELDPTNPKNLRVSLNDSLTPSTSYDVTVLAIKDSE